MSTSDTMAIRPLPQLLFPDDLQFWYETLRWLGLTAYGGADFGEVVTTAQRISAGLYDSWYEQWAATAARVEAEARAQLRRGPCRVVAAHNWGSLCVASHQGGCRQPGRK